MENKLHFASGLLAASGAILVVAIGPKAAPIMVAAIVVATAALVVGTINDWRKRRNHIERRLNG